MLCSAPFTFKIKYLTSFIPETDVCSSYCDKAHCERVGKYNFISEIAVRFGSVPFNPIVTKWNVENATPIKVGIVKWITDLNVSALSDWNICSEDEQWALKRFRLSNSIFSRRFNSITTLSLSLSALVVNCEIAFIRLFHHSWMFWRQNRPFSSIYFIYLVY